MQHGKEEFDRNYFGIFFKKYDLSELKFYYRWFKGWIRLLDQFLPIKNGQRKDALEVGCAIGAFSKLLRERGFNVVATDISKFIIDKAQKLQNDIDFRILDIEKGGSLREKFDYIFALEVLEHLRKPKIALLNMKKLLKKNGVFVFSTPLPANQTLADPMHINVHSPNYWFSLGKEVGFNKMFYEKVAFLPFLYRFSSVFSIGFRTPINLPFVNNTCFYFFRN